MGAAEAPPAPDPIRVLVVDDEPAIVEFLALGLRREGYAVRTATDGRAALPQVDAFDPDLVVLDIMMPRLDGFELTRQLSGHPRRGLLILSARDEKSDRIAGLELGADDYLVKPFDFDELLARLRAILRRRQPARSAVLGAGGIVVDRAQRTAQADGRPLELSTREFDLLAYLVEHAGEVCHRQQLLDAVWGHAFYGDENNLEVYIRYLRRKLNDQARQRIQTVRGVGYRLADG
ncbi:MAG TPA: response regulator transcription factor [Candidatus Dormibacteraeota bacterium]|nr:response regulator transcription factor [Candidatus Dormibacteraeota bacterium]